MAGTPQPSGGRRCWRGRPPTGWTSAPGRAGPPGAASIRSSPACTQGDSRYAYNLIQGPLGRAGDVGVRLPLLHRVSGKNRQTHVFSAVILDSDVVLQPLFIRPEGFFDKISEFFGADDIDFESAEFSRRFYVKARQQALGLRRASTRGRWSSCWPARRSTSSSACGSVICYRDRRFVPGGVRGRLPGGLRPAGPPAGVRRPPAGHRCAARKERPDGSASSDGSGRLAAGAVVRSWVRSSCWR